MAWRWIMRAVMLASAVFVLSAMLAGCTNPAEGPVFDSNQPDRLVSGDQVTIAEVTFDECAWNLASFCDAQAMYYASHNCYAPDIESLYQLLGDTLTCPWTGECYEVAFCGPDSFWIPCPNYPLHPGAGPGYYPPMKDLYTCRSQMRSIASSEAMFYGRFNRYGTMQEMIDAGYITYMTCPGCGYDYIIELGYKTYTLYCPMPQQPSHGSVVDGMFSWE